MPWYTFYKNRGISEQTIKDFGGGVKTYGKLNNRFVFPIYQGEKIVGLAGRDLYTNSQRPKWKILGRKANFVYPYKLTLSDIESSRCVILVESIGDALSLYEAGIKNFLVLFGLSVSKPVTLTLIKSNVDKIIIATNNDMDLETNRGMKAALGIKYKLSKFFSPDSIFVKLPYKKDFGDMKKQEIIDWYKSL
jgi:DNA primase